MNQTKAVGCRPPVRELQSLISCPLCQGYMIDPTTLDNCYHTFCRSCILKRVRLHPYCPQCKPYGIRPVLVTQLKSDELLRTLIYKLVPDLYQTECKRRNDFGEPEPVLETEIISSTDLISLSLEYHPRLLQQCGVDNSGEPVPPPICYLQCPAAFTMNSLKRFLCVKFNIDALPKRFEVEVIYRDEILRNDFTLMDICYIYKWNRQAPMAFRYRILIHDKPSGSLTERTNCASSNRKQSGDDMKAESASCAAQKDETVAVAVAVRIPDEKKSKSISKSNADGFLFLPPLPPPPINFSNELNQRIAAASENSKERSSMVMNKKAKSQPSSIKSPYSRPSKTNKKKPNGQEADTATKFNDAPKDKDKGNGNGNGNGNLKIVDTARLSYGDGNIAPGQVEGSQSSETLKNCKNLRSNGGSGIEDAYNPRCSKAAKNCNIVVSIPQSQLQLADEERVAFELKNASKKIPPHLPKLKIELGSLKSKLAVPKMPDERRDDTGEQQELDLNTYAQKIGLQPIENRALVSTGAGAGAAAGVGLLETTAALSEQMSKSNISQSSPLSSSSSTPSSSTASPGFLTMLLDNDGGQFSETKPRKKHKKKHSKDLRDVNSKRKKLHAEISSQTADGKMKVKITASHKSSHHREHSQASAVAKQEKLHKYGKLLIKSAEQKVHQSSASEASSTPADSAPMAPDSPAATAAVHESNNESCKVSAVGIKRIPAISPPLPPSLFKTATVVLNPLPSAAVTTLTKPHSLTHTKPIMINHQPTKVQHELASHKKATKPLRLSSATTTTTTTMMTTMKSHNVTTTTNFAKPNTPLWSTPTQLPTAPSLPLTYTQQMQRYLSMPKSIASKHAPSFGLKRSLSLDERPVTPCKAYNNSNSNSYNINIFPKYAKQARLDSGAEMQQQQQQQQQQLAKSHEISKHNFELYADIQESVSKMRSAAALPTNVRLLQTLVNSGAGEDAAAHQATSHAQSSLSLLRVGGTQPNRATESVAVSKKAASGSFYTYVNQHDAIYNFNNNNNNNNNNKYAKRNSTDRLMLPTLSAASANLIANRTNLTCSNNSNAIQVQANRKQDVSNADIVTLSAAIKDSLTTASVAATGTIDLSVKQQQAKKPQEVAKPTTATTTNPATANQLQLTANKLLQNLHKNYATTPMPPLLPATTLKPTMLFKTKTTTSNAGAGVGVGAGDELQNLHLLSDFANSREKVNIGRHVGGAGPYDVKLKQSTPIMPNPNAMVRQQNASVRNIPNPSALAFRNQNIIPSSNASSSSSSSSLSSLSSSSSPFVVSGAALPPTYSPTSAMKSPLSRATNVTPLTAIAMSSSSTIAVPKSLSTATGLTTTSRNSPQNQSATATASASDAEKHDNAAVAQLKPSAETSALDCGNNNNNNSSSSKSFTPPLNVDLNCKLASNSSGMSLPPRKVGATAANEKKLAVASSAITTTAGEATIAVSSSSTAATTKPSCKEASQAAETVPRDSKKQTKIEQVAATLNIRAAAKMEAIKLPNDLALESFLRGQTNVTIAKKAEVPKNDGEPKKAMPFTSKATSHQNTEKIAAKSTATLVATTAAQETKSLLKPRASSTAMDSFLRGEIRAGASATNVTSAKKAEVPQDGEHKKAVPFTTKATSQNTEKIAAKSTTTSVAATAAQDTRSLLKPRASSTATLKHSESKNSGGCILRASETLPPNLTSSV